MAQSPAQDLAANPKASAALALHRFGLGPRPGSIAAIASDARGALLAELVRLARGLTPAKLARVVGLLDP